VSSFEDLKLTRQFLNALEDAGYTAPTPVQIKAIPAVMSGQHVVGIAQTGTGKTAAYLLPILQSLKYAQGVWPRALVLVPTKELVTQVMEHVVMLSKYTDLRAVALYGGVGKSKQSDLLKAGADIIVSTPLRLVEHYQDGNLVLKQIKTLVLDEADRMMDMGFMPQLEMLLDILPTKKQNLLFSATFSPRIEKLSGDFMDFPLKIEIDQEATPAETIAHWRYSVPNFETKLNLLNYLMKDRERFNRIIVFTKTRQHANMVFDELKKTEKGKVKVMHANKDQHARMNAMKAFKAGELRVLVTTDVTARGIDVTEVSHVINFDVPLIYEDYVHRIGRTGRAGLSGEAITFVNKAEEYHINRIEYKIRQAIPELPMPDAIGIAQTPFEENQMMELEIDAQKRKEDPTFKGAFHEKKNAYARAKQKSAPKSLKRATTPDPFAGRKKTSKSLRHKKK
jgi:ATP-dependent RNA helicase RhlE